MRTPVLKTVASVGQLTTPSFPFSWLVFTLIFLPFSIRAVGSADLFQEGQNPVMLLVGDPDFGNFATYTAPSTNRIQVRIASAGEVIYLGLSRAYRFDGRPQNYGQYNFRIRRLEDDQLVHGPFTVNAANENLSSWEQASIGPDALFPGGYPVANNYRYEATQAGTYIVEFENIRYLGLWDISVGDANGTEKTGRVYSQNWAFRVPDMDAQSPDCVWGAKLNSRFYSYTSDGFVTLIDFEDSGFQPLSFNLAFNRTGPGQAGDLQLDRMSVPNQNLTESSAEHLIFIEAPDPLLFPDGLCGQVNASDRLQCMPDNTYCLPVEVTRPGQVEVTLDFNGNQNFDPETDILLLGDFTADNLSQCLVWDGHLPDGSRVSGDVQIDIYINFSQGVQHWALYDGELMREGFCVMPIRPLCGNGLGTQLYYDDRNIPEVSGTNAQRDGRSGCDCESPDCRTWTNFEANTTDCNIIDDAITTGYGDKNTLNTWWFAAVQSAVVFDVPISIASISGPQDRCPGEEVKLVLNWQSGESIENIIWQGPNGFGLEGPAAFTAMVRDNGRYTVSVTDEEACTTTATYDLLDVVCSLGATIISIDCDDNGSATDSSDDTFTASFVVNGSNDAAWSATSTTTAAALSGAYGETINVGPFPVSGGSISYFFTDDAYSCCVDTLVISPPSSCLESCLISHAFIPSKSCNDNGTPLDPSDDTFIFEVLVEGLNVSSHWNSSEGTSGNYGVATTFGPYLIREGNRNIVFTDSEDTACSVTAIIGPPASCSNQCSFTPELSNIRCEDGGTPADPSDDQFYFDLLVEGVNGNNSNYQLQGQGVYPYDSIQTFGPFSIIAGDFELFIHDAANTSCRQTLSVSAPDACSNQCDLVIEDWRLGCDDKGSSNAEDDVYYYEVLVNFPGNNHGSWLASDGSSGNYGEYVRSIDHTFFAEGHTIIISDALNTLCIDTFSLVFPEPELSCPDDVNTIAYPNTNIQSIGGFTKLVSSAWDTAQDTICWLQEDSLENGVHYYDRFSFRRNDTLATEAKLFTFYLFSDMGDSSAVGALFRLSAAEPIDCCDLINSGAISPWEVNDLHAPYLNEAYYPEGMVLSQQFSALLNPQEDYTLVTSSWLADTTGNFTWVVLSSQEESLMIYDANRPNISSDGQLSYFDLYTLDIGSLQNQSASLASLGSPVVEEGCGVVAISPQDEVEGACDSITIHRNFSYQLGEEVFQSSCQQTIGLRHLGLGDLILPAEAMMFSCTDSYPVLPNAHPHPNFTGWPAVYHQGTTVMIDSIGFGELSATFTDTTALRPDGGLNVYRHWVITDNCTEEQLNYSQLFKLEAVAEPYFACPTSNHYCPIIEEDIMLFPMDSFECTATVFIPYPDLVNICDSQAWAITSRVYRLQTLADGTIDTLDIALLRNGDKRYLAGLESGDYFIYYLGTHPTKLAQELRCRFRVADMDPPSPICRSLLNLSLPGSGIVRVFPQQINRGSYDNCTEITMQLRRRYAADSSHCALQYGNQLWSEWGAYVEFDCCDVGREWEVELLVSDASGNSSYCTSVITVADNSRPYCTGLVNTTVGCSDLPQGFSARDTLDLQALFGYPEVVDNCSSWARELPPIVEGDACQPERVVRQFLAIDEHGNQASNLFTQTINISGGHQYSIRLPKDTFTNCTSHLPAPLVFSAGCDSISIAHAGAVLVNESNACRYIARTYTITNWCEWDGLAPARAISRDEDCNGIDGDQDIWLLRLADTAYVDADSLAFNNIPLIASRGEDCGNNQNPEGHWRGLRSTGRWEYTQYIQIFDETPPTLAIDITDSLCVDTFSCLQQVTLDIVINDYCQDLEGSITISWDLDADGTIDGSTNDNAEGLERNFPSYRFQHDFPVGRHKFIITAKDDCGNEVSEEVFFNLFDCYVPDLVCSNGELFNLQALTEISDIDNDGEPDAAAVLVEAGDLGSCFQLECSDGLRYSINRVGENPDINRSSLYLKCSDRYQTNLEIYVWDQAYNPFCIQPDGSVGGPNWKSCTVWVFVQDPNLACPNCGDEEALTIAGTIRTAAEEALAGVEVLLQEEDISMLTTSAGQYQFRVEAGVAYTIHAHKNDDTRKGLSTLDLIILQRHVLGMAPLDSAPLLLAADVNFDGQINVQDLLLLQSVILGRIESFPNNYSWRFVPENWDGSEPVNDAIDLEPMQSCMDKADMLAIKIGDLNQSYNSSNITTNIATARNASNKEALKLKDQEVATGDLSALVMYLPDGARYAGGQISLEWDTQALRYEGFSSEALQEQALNTQRVAAGELRLSYIANWEQEQPSLRIKFRANKPGKLSDWIKICDRCELKTEVYRQQELTADGVEAVWVAEQQELEETSPDLSYNALLQAIPNPAREQIQLGLYVEESQQVQLTITNANGRQMNSTQIHVTKGENRVSVALSDWPAGVYHYSFLTRQGVLSGKLVKM